MGYFEAHRDQCRDCALIIEDIFCGVVPMGVEKQALAAEGWPSGPVLKPGGGPGQPDLLRIGAAAEMTIYLIRHGKTLANERRLYCGSTELSLSEQGREELKDRPDYQIWLTGDNERNVPPAAKAENR